jgi:hypothetical protein
MRFLSLIAAGALMLASASVSSAAPLYSTPAASESSIVLVQEKKSETIGEKVKRTWRKWTTPNYTFCVRCPIILPITAAACSAQAKDKEAARAACAQRNPLCLISDDMRNCGK